ncbi:DegV family protein [Butyrivibrio sp. YAB3001]|uniref:DegV family protein n=1 Tax=Butyrivibrio sp. YAB3001 TaxID=1520812 RepID=UPI0008F66E19|nr:DegV family protein [Butyrivibrio sp. YAB3001]SFD05750.1 EDD domain protein, DegV family [Butyrivibrio sp. YAB3001]
MISRFFMSIIERLKDSSRSFKERVFILLTMVTVLAIALALIGDIVCGENVVEIVTLVVTIIIVPVITLVSVMKNNVVLAVRIIVIGLVCVILPILFYFGGGVEGGGVLWLIFAYLYTGVVLSGKWKPVLLTVLTFEACIFYATSYFYPDLISGHPQNVFYIDSLLSVIVIGIVGCLMVWFEEWLFREENKRAREETSKIEELVRAQNRFFSSMSHELRTPINSILGLNEIILRQKDASDEIIRDANNIQGAGRMLLSLINDILDLSKIEAGKMDIIPVNYNLGVMVSEIANMMWMRAEQKGLEFKIEIDPSIPAEMFGDEVRIKQILVNLLNNAIKYTKEGTVTLHIEKEELHDNEIRLLFSVIDTGTGIKQDTLPYLFDAFQRVDEEKNSKIEGTGLGLAIVKQLVDLMDGKITVSSVYMEGSTFMVSLWQKVTSPDAIGNLNISDYEKNKTRSEFIPEFTAPEVRILIVDDNEMNLAVESKLLYDTEMEIDTAINGEDALSMTLNDRYDVILMDHLMPGMDGIKCMQLIRNQTGGLNKHVPIIVVTANAGTEDIELYNSSGFDGYILKPVSGKQLEEKLLEYIPEYKVVRSAGTDLNKVQMNTARGYSKKLPVIVATSSMCDLPEEVISECGIDILPFSIHVGGKTYYDRYEASTDEVVYYMKNGLSFDSSAPTVEEFEVFFGQEVKKAHQVIYFTLPPEISKEYENATEAAKAYGNILIFNSDVNSSAMGMLVLFAHRMALQGRNAEKIMDELNYLKTKMSCSFVTSDAGFMMKRGTVGKGIYSFMKIFDLRPGLCVKNGKLSVTGMYVGELGKCYEKYIDNALPKRIKPDLDVIFVDYIELRDEEMKSIEARIRKRFAFEHIIFQKASAVMSLNCGMGAIGLAYAIKGDHPYRFDQIFSPVFRDDEEDVIYKEEEPLNTEMMSSVEEPKWYDDIKEIDVQKAIENSGSEETFKGVLKIFYDSVIPKSKEIESLYNNENWNDYTIKVHALKSSARIVGATELGDEAERLEMAGKKSGLNYIKEHTQSFLQDLMNLREKLSSIYEDEGSGKRDKKEDKIEKSTKEDKKQEYDNILIRSAYQTIQRCVEEENISLLKRTLVELEDYDVSDYDRRILDNIKECCNEENYEKISDLLPKDCGI